MYIIDINAAGLVALGPLALHRSHCIMFKGKNVHRKSMYITLINTYMKTYIYVYVYMYIDIQI